MYKDLQPKPENAPVVPILVSRFDEIKKIPKITTPKVEDISSIYESKSGAEHSFEEAKKAFFYIYDSSRIKKYLEEEPLPEGSDYLRRVRRFGLILRAHYIFFDIKHETPMLLHLFISKLGNYNDNYWQTDERRNESALPLVEAIGLMDKIEPENLKINFCTKENFKKNAQDILSEMTGYASSESLNAEKFHNLRKRVRACADIIQVTASEDKDQKLNWLFSSILSLSDELAKIHDQSLENCRVKQVNFNECMIDVANSIKEKFAALRPFIEKFLGL